MIVGVFLELENIRATLPEPNFCLLYGSHACDVARNDSDIDLMFFVSMAPKDISKLIQHIVDLHHKYQSTLDVEVPYDNKLVVSYGDAEKAINLEQFLSSSREIFIPPLKKDSSYMSSINMRQRLIFNALTSPHIFVGGDMHAYCNFKLKAEKSLASLAVALANQPVVTKAVLLHELKHGRNGQEGEDHLGYKDRPSAIGRMWTSLGIGLAQLEEVGWVVRVSPETYERTSVFPYRLKKSNSIGHSAYHRVLRP